MLSSELMSQGVTGDKLYAPNKRQPSLVSVHSAVCGLWREECGRQNIRGHMLLSFLS